MVLHKFNSLTLIAQNVMVGCWLMFTFSCSHPAPYQDVTFHSEVFQTDRQYRIYLPSGYQQHPNARYPVVYYFHGWGGRYKWDNYDLDDDINYPENGRKEPPFVMEWKDYVQDHPVIIVTWDGYEPNLHPGKKFREGIPYGDTSPYDYRRAHDQEDHHWGWDYRRHFRELVAHVDENFRTVADRDHRAISGLSMGGLTAYYVAGQNKDLVSSVSAFDPADNVPLYGPRGEQVAFPVLEMYRALEGLSVRLTMTDGDWLKYNDWELARIFEAAHPAHFEWHVADYPDHWAADIDQQLDFHRAEFQKEHRLPENWSHVCPAFPSFSVWDYQIDIQRTQPALTLLEDVSPGHMKVVSRPFVPNGPIVQDERVAVTTGAVYSPDAPVQLTTYNLSDGKIEQRKATISAEGKLTFELGGGGHLIGINRVDSASEAIVKMVHLNGQEHFYFEEGVAYRLDFTLVNIGQKQAESIEIRASSTHPYLTFTDSIIWVDQVAAGASVALKDQFDFSIAQHHDSSQVGTLRFDVKVNGLPNGTQKIMFFTVPASPHLEDSDDMIVLDGRTVADVPVYQPGPNEVQPQEIAGGQGNGNGVWEPGEEALVYIRLPRGMAPNDTNTFHRTYLLNHLNVPLVEVNRLDYDEKVNQAGATSVATIMSLSEGSPDTLDLWFRVESLFNDRDDSTSRATVYARRYDYRRAKVKIDQSYSLAKQVIP